MKLKILAVDISGYPMPALHVLHNAVQSMLYNVMARI